MPPPPPPPHEPPGSSSDYGPLAPSPKSPPATPQSVKWSYDPTIHCVTHENACYTCKLFRKHVFDHLADGDEALRKIIAKRVNADLERERANDARAAYDRLREDYNSLARECKARGEKVGALQAELDRLSDRHHRLVDRQYGSQSRSSVNDSESYEDERERKRARKLDLRSAREEPPQQAEPPVSAPPALDADVEMITAKDFPPLPETAGPYEPAGPSLRGRIPPFASSSSRAQEKAREAPTTSTAPGRAKEVPSGQGGPGRPPRPPRVATSAHASSSSRARGPRAAVIESVGAASLLLKKAHIGGPNNGPHMETVELIRGAVREAHELRARKQDLNEVQAFILEHWQVPKGLETSRARMARQIAMERQMGHMGLSDAPSLPYGGTPAPPSIPFATSAAFRTLERIAPAIPEQTLKRVMAALDERPSLDRLPESIAVGAGASEGQVAEWTAKFSADHDLVPGIRKEGEAIPVDEERVAGWLALTTGAPSREPERSWYIACAVALAANPRAYELALEMSGLVIAPRRDPIGMSPVKRSVLFDRTLENLALQGVRPAEMRYWWPYVANWIRHYIQFHGSIDPLDDIVRAVEDRTLGNECPRILECVNGRALRARLFRPGLTKRDPPLDYGTPRRAIPIPAPPATGSPPVYYSDWDDEESGSDEEDKTSRRARPRPTAPATPYAEPPRSPTAPPSPHGGPESKEPSGDDAPSGS